MVSVKIRQLVILLFFIQSLNFLETESIAVLVPDPTVTPLDILAKAKKYYNIAKSSLNIRKEEREKALNCSDDLCIGNVLAAVPEICAGDEKDFSKCALKMFMSGSDLEVFRTPDWVVTVILFFKHLLDGAHSFALCSQYYNQSYNAVFFHQIRDACREVSNYFSNIAFFMTDQLINLIVRIHRPKYERSKYSELDYVNMPLEKFYQRFPKTVPSDKDKTIHAIRYLYEYKRYIESLLNDKSKRCLLLDKEDRLKCLLDGMDELHENIKIILQNLEFYLDSISCKSTLSFKPSWLNEKPLLVLKTYNIIWESLSFITETLQTHSQDKFDQCIDILTEIEKRRVKTVAKYNGQVLEKEPGTSEAAEYEAIWGDGSSKEDFIWLANV